MKLSNNPGCERDGCPYPAVEVDHIVPMAIAPERRYDWDNLMSLCKPHHDEKTKQDALRGRQAGRTPMIYVVTGPPAAGKSTWVREHAQDGDLTIDFDDLGSVLVKGFTRDLESMPKYAKVVLNAARTVAIDEAINQHVIAATNGTHCGDVYVIHSKPSADDYERYLSCGATITEVDPGIEECLRRAEGERTGKQIALIRQWYRRKGA